MRELIRTKSLSIDPSQRDLLSKQLAAHLLSYLESRADVSEIVGFKSFRDEIDLAPFVSELSRRKIRYRALAMSDVLTEVPQLVIVPGVAFDVLGNRLGRGKGFYDDLLRSLRTKGGGHVAIGVMYDHQLLESVPVEEHDERVDFVCTPLRGLVRVRLDQD